MNRKFTYKVKKKLLFLFTLLLVIVIYQRVLKRTYHETSNYFFHSSKNINQERIKDSILSLKDKVEQIEEALGEDDFDENFIQQEILEFLSNKSKENVVEITNLKKTHIVKEKEYTLVTTFFTLKGSYNSLIKIMYEVEREFKKSKLNSVGFYKKKNHSLKREELHAELLFQNFKSN
ncbi:hypothetical protein [Tenacibaculum sp.]